MKIKIFSSSNIDKLENQVNEFLETVSNVIDIKYGCAESCSDVMVIYNETKAAE